MFQGQIFGVLTSLISLRMEGGKEGKRRGYIHSGEREERDRGRR